MRHGFTLIELLVVVAIIGVLVGLMLPTLGRAREAGRASVCLSNLRQFTTAAGVYLTSYRGQYPFAYDYGDMATAVREWDYLKPVPLGSGPIRPGILWDHAGAAAQVHQCPSFDGSANAIGDPFTGYNYNTSYLGGFRQLFAATWTPSTRQRDVADPADTAVFGDGQYAAGANKFMRSPLAGPRDASFSARHAGAQGFRHLNATQVGYADGHAAATRERFTHSTTHVTANLAEGTGFLSHGNSRYDLD